MKTTIIELNRSEILSVSGGSSEENTQSVSITEGLSQVVGMAIAIAGVYFIVDPLLNHYMK